MKSRMQLVNSDQVSFDFKLPDRSNDEKDEIIEHSGFLELTFGKGSYQTFYFDEVIIGFCDYIIFDETIFHVESDWEVVKMYFVLNGNLFTTDNSSGKGFTFGSNQHNIIYKHMLEGLCKWGKNNNMKVFEISLTPTFLEKYLYDHFDFEAFRKHMSTNTNTQISNHNQLITPKMSYIINEILTTKRSGPYMRMFVEAKIIELLMLQLEQISENKGNRLYTLNKQEVDRMYGVKEIILNNINSTFSLIDLAKQVGTNEFTLKKGFKEMFGTTVFGFWHHTKMEEAKKLLFDTNKTISEISDDIGYKNARHFSRAFKKHYGKSPREMTKGKNGINGV